MTTIQDILHYLETIAPLAYQEPYDNTGVLVGNIEQKVKNVLICLDITTKIIVEAQQKQCNLIIAHHPILFNPIKSITGKNEEEKIIIEAIKHNLVLYAIHTNLDKIYQGVNKQLAQQLGLKNLEILLPQKNTLCKLTTFIPQKDTSPLLEKLYKAGAGNLGKYTECSFTTQGIGTFKPKKNAHPYIKSTQAQHTVEENRIEIFFPTYLKKKIIQTLLTHHPYEEVVYDVFTIANENKTVGSGMIGNLVVPLLPIDFLALLKQKLQLTCIRYKQSDKKIQKIAICGGSGSFLIEKAIQKNVDAYVTADLKYHDYFRAEKILLADIGHYESEIYTKTLLKNLLSKKFINIAFKSCTNNTNPIFYFV